MQHFSVSQISHRHEFFYIRLNLFFDSLVQSFGILLYVFNSFDDFLFKDIDSLFQFHIIILQFDNSSHFLICIFIFD